jgi:hypothetical protein
VFWYLVPILGVALVLAFLLKEVPLSDVAGMVARGEAVESEEELAALTATPGTVEPVVTEAVVIEPAGTDRDDDPRAARAV